MKIENLQVAKFVKKFNLKMVMAMNRIEFNFEPNQSFMTIFSAPKYTLECENKRAVVHFDENFDFYSFVFGIIGAKFRS